MKILIIGDIYGNLGRDAVAQNIANLKTTYEIDFIIANCENVSHGKSMIYKHYQQLKTLGIDVFTSGNHIFANHNILEYIDTVDDVLRPINFSPYQPGKGSFVYKVKNKTIRVTNLIGRTFMDKYENPYYALKMIVDQDTSDLHIVDLHAEATGEKISIAWDFDGSLTCLVGTHTHVQTVDNRLLPKGTAFISDIGFCGAYDSIIGADPTAVIKRDKTGLPSRFAPATITNRVQFSAVILEVDDKTNQAIRLRRILINPDHPEITLRD